jgi:hypothetical protein
MILHHSFLKKKCSTMLRNSIVRTYDRPKLGLPPLIRYVMTKLFISAVPIPTQSGVKLTKFAFSELDFETISDINIVFKTVPSDLCTKLIKKISNITAIDDSTQICGGNGRFIIPGSCQNVAGGSWVNKGRKNCYGEYTEEIPYLLGVESFGVDCGFGIPAVASNVSSFIPWIDSVLYPDKNIEPINSKVAGDFRSIKIETILRAYFFEKCALLKSFYCLFICFFVCPFICLKF